MLLFFLVCASPWVQDLHLVPTALSVRTGVMIPILQRQRSSQMCRYAGWTLPWRVRLKRASPWGLAWCGACPAFRLWSSTPFLHSLLISWSDLKGWTQLFYKGGFSPVLKRNVSFRRDISPSCAEHWTVCFILFAVPHFLSRFYILCISQPLSYQKKSK